MSDECPRDLEEGRLGLADRDLPSNSDAGVGLEVSESAHDSSMRVYTCVLVYLCVHLCMHANLSRLDIYVMFACVLCCEELYACIHVLLGTAKL